MTKRNINGVLLLDKPQGLTSNGALQRVKHFLQARKAGHTGSLDPLATGMLPLCFGEATKFANLLLDADKTYVVTGRLGIKTNTADAEGEVIETISLPSDWQQKLPLIIESFKGEQLQVPPMFSALKHKGQKLYELARQGLEIHREARKIIIHDLSLLHFDETTLSLRVKCSKGTYIRTLIEDIAVALGTCAHVIQLRRLEVGPLSEDRMVTLAALETADDPLTHLQSVDSMILHLPMVTLSSEFCQRICQGHFVTLDTCELSGLVRMYTHHQGFIGLGEVNIDKQLSPKRLISC